MYKVFDRKKRFFMAWQECGKTRKAVLYLVPGEKKVDKSKCAVDKSVENSITLWKSEKV